MINEIDDADDASVGDASVVSVENEKNSGNLLKASSNEDALKSSETPELRDKDTQSMDVTVAAGTSVTIEANMEYDYWYLQMSTDGTNFQSVKTDTGHSYWYDLYTFTPESGSYYFKLVNYYGRYGSPSEILKYTVGAAVEETETSISVNPTTVAPNNLITITPTVTKKGTSDAVDEGTVKFFYGDGTEMGEIDLSTQTSFEYTSGFADEGTYNIYAVYQANDNYAESTSDAVSVLVSQDTTKTPVTVTLELSKSGVAPGETITITPIVKNNNGEDVTGVVDLYDGNDNLIASGVAIGSPYSYAVSETSGEYQVYAKYLGNDDLAYAPGNSVKYGYKVKKQVQITLTASANEVTPSSYGSSSVTFIISCSETLPELKLYLNDEEFSTVSAGTTSTSISFDSSDVGLNSVYVYLAENDDFVEAKSNTETVSVYSTVSVTPSITLNQSSVVEGDKILVTVTASNNAPGTISIYSDSSYQNEIATIPVGESYEYTVPVSEGSSSYYTGYIYAYYNDYNDGYTRYTHYAYASGSRSFTVLRQNNAVLTGNGKTDLVEIDFGDSVVLHIDLDYWKQTSQYDSSYNTVYVSNVVIYLDGQEFDSFEVNRESSGYYDYTYTIADYTITFGDDGDEGTHTIYAYYKGSNEYGSYYAPATSNELTVNVKASSIATTTTLTASDAAPKYGDKITITPSVNDGEVTTGTITYYIGDTAISEAIALDTPFEYTVDGVAPVTITGKFAGEGYAASEGTVEISPVKADNNIVVTATTVDYPNKVNIKVSADVEGTYTVTVGDKTFDVVANSENGVDYQFAASDDDYVATVADWTHDYYEPMVTPATFKVNKGSNTVTVTADEVVLPDGAVTVYVTADVVGTYTVILNDGTEVPVVVSEANVKASGTSDKKLAAGTYTATTSFSDNENYTVTINPGEFEVKKGVNTITVSASTPVTYPGEVTISVVADVEGTYNVKIGEKTIPVVANGEGVKYKFAASETPYTATVDDWTSDDYTASVTPATFTVSKGTNNIVVAVTSPTYPDEVTITVTADVDGTYNVKIGEKVIPVVANGEGVKYKFAASETPYTATVDDWTSENYTASVTPATFTVNKGINNINIIVDENNYLPGDVTVKVTADVDGIYTVKIGEESVDVEVTGGEGTNTISLPADVDYQATTSFADDENYTVAIIPATFNVLKSDVELRIIINPIPAGESVSGTVIASVPGTYSIKIADNTPFDVEVTGTSKEFTSDITLPIGEEYVAEVSISNNPNYNDVANQTTFKVIANAVDFKASSTKSEYVYGEEVILTYELPEDADGNIIFTYSLGATGEAGKIIVPSQTQLSLGILGAKDYSIQAEYDGGSLYESSTKTINFKVAQKANDVTVAIADVEYGKDVTVNLSNAAEGTYTVNINGKSINVEVGSDGSGSATESIDLAVGTDYKATVSLDDDNYITSGETTFDVTPALNVITVTVNPSDVAYGEQITVTVEASVPDVYEVDVAGQIVKVNVTGASNSNTTTVNVDVGTDYEANVAWSNANYTANIQNAKFNVVQAINNVEITIASVEYSSEITVNVRADKAGTYTVKLDDAHSVDVVVSADGESGETTSKIDLAVNKYQATTSFDDDNYDTRVTGGEFEITPAKNTVKITVESPISYGDEVTVTVEASVSDTYTVTIGDKTVDVKVEDASKAVTVALDLDASKTAYVATTSWENENYTLELTEGSLIVNPKTNKVAVEIADVTLPEKVTVNVTANVAGIYRIYFNEDSYVDVDVEANVKKSVTQLLAEGTYSPRVEAQFENANYAMDYTVTETFTVNPEEISDDLIRILDYDYQANSTITIVSDDNVTIRVVYYLEEPAGSYYYGQEVRLNIGGQIKSVTPTYNQWVGFTYEFNETEDLTVSARYIALNLMGEDIDVTSNEITYHIIINRPEPVINNISIESKEVDYGTKANLTVNGTDGEYIVTVDKDYDVTVLNGTGYVIVDVLAGNKTYDVTIVSKTNSSLTNTSTLTVNPISPELTLSATNVAPTYGEAITITADKNADAAGTVKFYEGDKEVNVADVILAGGKHTITAKYAADGNFTEESADIEINVKEAVNELDLEITSPIYPENVTITLKASVPGDYEVIIAGNTYTVTVADNGVGTKSIKLIPNEQYTATVDYKGNGNYSDNSATSTFKVFGNTIGLNATAPETAEICQSVELNSSSKISEATGKVTYSFDDGTADIIADIGEVVSYTPKTAGEHTISVTYDDGIFDPETVTLTIVVSKKQNNIKVEVDGSTYPDNVTVKVTADVEGDYTIDINGSIYTVTANGDGKSINLAAGSYYANVTYSDDEYDGITTNATFEVEKGTNNVKVEVSSVELPSKVIAYITADVAGTYRIYFDEDNYVDVEVKSSEKTASEEVELAGGNYITNVEFTNDNYVNNVVNAEFDVSKVDSEFKLNLTTTEFTVNEEVIIKFTLPSDATGKVTFRFADGTIAGEKEVGPGLLGATFGMPRLLATDTTEYQISLGKLPAGEYPITAEYSGDEVYNKASQTTDLKVYEEVSDVVLKIRDAAFPENATIVINSKENVSITLQYYFTKPDETLISPVIDGYINGEHLNGFGLYEFEKVVSGSYATFGTLYNISESCELDIYVVFTSQQMSIFGHAYNVTSNHVKYIINIEPEVESNLTVEAIGISYPANASVVVKTNKAGDYIVTVNGKDYAVAVDGEAIVTLDVLPANEYDVTVKAKDNASFTNSTKLIISKGMNNVKVEASDVTLPSNVTVKVTADVAGTYTIKLNETESITVTIGTDGGSASESVALDVGTYTPSLVGYADDNYDAVVDAKSFTVSPEVISDVILIIRDATYTDNATITINSKENVSITLQYYFTKPDETLISPVIDGYINGEHLSGFGLYEFEKVVSGSYATFGTLYNISESCELDIYVVFTSQQMSIFGHAYNVTSNHIKYVINIEDAVESNLTVEAESVDDLTNATVVVKSNVPGEYIVSVNGSDYAVVIGDSGVNSTTIKVLPAGEYTVTVTAKDNASFTNSTILVVSDAAVPVPDSLTVEAIGISYPANASVVVKTNKDGDYIVTVNGKDYAVAVDGEAIVTLDVLPANEYDVTVKAKDIASFTNSTKLIISKGINNVKVEASDVTLPSNVTVKVTADVAGTYTIKLDDDHEVTVTIATDGGSASEEISLAEGAYTPALVDYADDNYDAVVDAESFTVSPEVISDVILIIRDATYVDNSTIVINSKENVSITLQYYFTKPDETLISPAIDGYINGEHLNGFGLYEFEKVVSGSYATFGTLYNISESCELDIYVVFTSQQMSIFGHAYNVTSNHIKYIINIERNETPSLSVEADSVDDLTNATVVIKSNKAGNYVVNVNGKDYVVAVDGEATVTLDILPAGNHTVTVTSKENSSLRNETTLTVSAHKEDEKGNITIDTADKTDVGVHVDIPGATGNIIVIVDGNETSVALIDGKADYPVGDLGAGNHSIVVVYLGDDTHDATYASESFSIAEEPVPEPIASEVNVNVPSDIEAGDNATVEVSIPNATGNVTVIIDGKETVVALDENGTASVPINDIASGDHSVVVIYSGDETHAPAHSVSNFNVSEIPAVVPIASEFVNITIMEDLNISVKLVDAKGNPISNAKINYVVGDVSNSTVTDADGLFTIAGVNGAVIAIDYAGNDTYLATNTSIKFDSPASTRLATQFNVTNGFRLQVYAVDYKAGERGAYFDVLLTDTNGNRLVNQSVVFAINGWVHNKTTDANGVAHLQINLQDANYYTCAPCYLGNTTYNATFASAMLDVIKKPITISAAAKSYKATAKTKKYTVTLKTIKGSSADGKIYLKSGKIVKLTVNGKTYSAKINAKGQATFALKLTKKGKYQATIKFAGDKTYNSASKKVKITIK